MREHAEIYKLQVDNFLPLSLGAWLTAFRISSYVYESSYQLLLSVHVALWVIPI